MRSYQRTFFVLKEETQGYGGSGFGHEKRVPQGRMVIEVRGSNCKILVYAQDLRAGNYKAVLVKRSDAGSRAVTLGNISAGAGRSVEVRFDTDPDNVFAGGLAIEEFDIGAIIHENGRPVVVLSSDSFDGRWKSNLEIKQTTVQSPSVKLASYTDIPGFGGADETAKTAGRAEERDARTTEGAKNAEKTKEEENNPHTEFKETVKRLNKELIELAELAEDRGQAREGGEEEASVSAEEEAGAEADEKVDVSGFDLGVWKEIGLKELSLLPVNSFDPEEKAVIASSFYTRGKLIISGAEADSGASYIIGVPGTNSPAEEGGFRRLGFYDFKGDGEEGYWLKKIK